MEHPDSFDYDVFFDRYDIESSNITQVVELLKIFQIYLDSIYLEVFRLRFRLKSGKPQVNFKTVIDTLTKYMIIIYNYYNKIDIYTISHNIDINYHFVDTMTVAIIILYSYIYFQNISHIDSHRTDSISIRYGKYTDSTLKFIMYRILTNCYTVVNTPKPNEILYKFKDIIYNSEPQCRKFIENQTNVIVDFIKKISRFNGIKPSNSRYVTIPKYTGICWFVSFVVGICYSDGNKALLLEKETINNSKIKTSEDNTTLTATEIFTTLIYRIINEITKERKTYNEIDETTMNELNIYLKKTPIQFLLKLLNDYTTNNISDYDDYDLIEYSCILKHINDKSYKSINLNDIDKLGDFGINNYNYCFLVVLYKLVNINSLYLLKSKDKWQVYNNVNKNPDILIVNTTSGSEDFITTQHTNINGKKVQYIDITEDITYNTQEITFNGHKYELDYIIYGSDSRNSWENTGHAIVALNYDKNEYFYDSRYYISEYTYKEHTLRYPCPLIKQSWKQDYISNSAKFCVKKCFHTEINHLSQLYRNSKDLTEDDICYTSNSDMVCCYVKSKEEVKKTGGENLTSTRKKISFVIDNKKYERIIYIDNNGIEYIKFNKKSIRILKK